MNTNNLRNVLVYTHPVTLACAMVGIVGLALAVVLMVLLAMMTVSLALAWLVGEALRDETRAIWRSLTLWGNEQGSTPQKATDRPDPIVVGEPIPVAVDVPSLPILEEPALPWGIPMEEPTPDVVEMVPDAHIVNPVALEGLADAMNGEPTPTLQAAETVVTPKVKRSRKPKVKMETTPPIDWEGVETSELVAACRAAGIKATCKWKRETMIARLSG